MIVGIVRLLILTVCVHSWTIDDCPRTHAKLGYFKDMAKKIAAMPEFHCHMYNHDAFCESIWPSHRRQDALEHYLSHEEVKAAIQVQINVLKGELVYYECPPPLPRKKT